MRLHNPLDRYPTISVSLSPTPSFPANTDGQDPVCHGLFYDVVLVIPSALFLCFLAYHAKKNFNKLYNGSRSYIMISYYALLWSATLLNFAWCAFQVWQCSSGTEAEWNLLSLLTKSSILCLEISLVAFLLQDNYASGLETLARTFTISGIIVGVDALLKAIYVFGFGIPLFIDSFDTTEKMKWGLLSIHDILLTAVYGFILFVRFSKWRDNLPPRPGFYNYIVAMFVLNAAASFACGLVLIGASFGLWLYSLTVVFYHTLYLPLLYVTFLADFFQEEDFLLENAYYSEMRDAGFFDADWE